MNKITSVEILDEMVRIYETNYKGEPLTCALLPYTANIYLNAIVEVEKNASDYSQVAHYRKIERCFVDDEAGTAEMTKLFSLID